MELANKLRGREDHMKTFFRLSMAAILALATVPSLTAQTVKVGTFDKASIVVAFYGSPLWSAQLKAKEAELRHAKQANDQKRLDELNRWGGDSQELADKQVAGEASIANILTMLQPVFPAVADQAHVALIAPELAYAGSSVETVDVTGLLLDQLQATPRTRQVIDELRKSQKGAASK